MRQLTIHEQAIQIPAVMQTQAHERTSDRYRFISSADLVPLFADYGFIPVSAKQSKVKDKSREGFQKHIVTFENPTLTAKLGIENGIFRASWQNAHDRSSAGKLITGFNVWACLNGLVFGDTQQELRLRHSGKLEDIETLIREALQKTGQSADTIRAMEDRKLDENEIDQFGSIAWTLRTLQPLEPARVPTNPARFIRREHDRGNSLWSVFNRTQENLIDKGGLKYFTDNGRQATIRPVKAIDRNIELNRKFWQLAETYLQ